MIVRGVLLSRARLARNVFFPRRGGRRFLERRQLIALVIGMGLATFMTLALLGLFLALEREGASPRDAAIALGLLFTGALIGMLTFDLHEAVSTLVLDSDLELLRRAPLPPWAMFALKLGDALPRTSAMLMILAIPAMIAFGIIYPVPAWSWVLMPLALVALWATSLGLGVAIAFVILRVVPSRTAREVLGLLSTFALLVLWVVNSFLFPRLVLATDSTLEMFRAIEAAAPPGYRYSPGVWIGEMLGAAASSEPLHALRALGAALGIGALMLFAAGAMAAWNLDSVQARVFGAASRSPSRGRGGAVRFAARPSAIRALLKRDLLLFVRDWTVIGDIAVASALWTLLPLVGGPLYDLDSAALARAMLLALTVALGYEVGTRAIPFERRGIAWVRLAPVSAWRWVLGRAVSTLAIALPIVALAFIGVVVALGLSQHEITGTLAIVLPALLIGLVIGLWTGAAHGNFDWAHPRAMLTLTGRALATVLLLMQAGAWFTWALLGAPRVSEAVAVLLPATLAVLAVPALLALTTWELERRTWT